MRPGETLLLTIALPNAQHIKIPDAVVRWSRGQEFAWRIWQLNGTPKLGFSSM